MLASCGTNTRAATACTYSGTATATAAKPGAAERTRKVERVTAIAIAGVARRSGEGSTPSTASATGTYRAAPTAKGAWATRYRGTCAASSTSTHTAAATGNDIGGAPARIAATTASACYGNPVADAIAAYAKVCRPTANTISTLAKAARVDSLRSLPTDPDGQGGTGSNGHGASHTPAKSATATGRIGAATNTARSATA
ncbi:hypothetical protein WH367_12985 [Comamonas sp. MYb21]|uniref:hypothetical protein n=1 Tax=unclassified Comamonas TaxID=2638500 RepID=UPI0003959E26|nr:hypothetical protein [Comamonas sp. B-9]